MDFLSNENLALDAELVNPWTNWMIPESNPIRYDTYFFLTAPPDGQKANGDTSEASSSGRFRLTTILDGWCRELLDLVSPTWVQLTRLDGVSTVAEAFGAAKDTSVRRTSSDLLGEPFMDKYFVAATRMGHLRKSMNR